MKLLILSHKPNDARKNYNCMEEGHRFKVHGRPFLGRQNVFLFYSLTSFDSNFIWLRHKRTTKDRLGLVFMA